MSDGRDECPDIWLLSNGDVAVIGRDLTEDHRGRLPEGVDSAGRFQEKAGLVAGLAGRAKGLGAAAFAPDGEGIRDHLMRSYPAALEKALA
ncbi:hypothetical protein [Kitasatospora sp. NPDC001095]